MMRNNSDKKIVGITGGIASGKTLVGEILKAEGFFVIDTDEITRRLNKKGQLCYNAIIKEFGNEFLNEFEEIDKRKFAAFIFKDKNLAKRLNFITHPIIIREIDKEIQNLDDSVIFVLVPLLFESNMQKRFYKVWTVSADKNIRIIRAQKRDNLKLEEIRNIIKNQLPEIERNKLADNILYNEGKAEDLKIQVLDALKTL